MAVCLFHFTDGNISFPGSSAWFEQIARYGWLGVEVFFVISGFIIPYSLYVNDYRMNMFPAFLLRRCLRIEPAYIASIVLVIILGYLSMMAPGYAGEVFQPSVAGTLLHIIYAPVYFGYKWLLPIYWSLEAELHFYILIGLIFPFINRNKIFLVTACVVLLPLSFFIPLFVFYFISLFLMGIAAFSFLVRKIPGNMFLAIVLASAICCYYSSGSLAIPVTGAVTAMVLAFADRFNPGKSWLGKISFSLYLVHIPIGGRLINILGRFDDSAWKVWLGLIVITVITIFSAYIFYLLIERPTQVFSKRIRYSGYETGSDNIPALSTR